MMKALKICIMRKERSLKEIKMLRKMLKGLPPAYLKGNVERKQAHISSLSFGVHQIEGGRRRGLMYHGLYPLLVIVYKCFRIY